MTAGAVARSHSRGLEKWVPGVHALRTYERGWLRRDLVAAIVLSALLVPQGMAYAELAGLPAITGLYTTVVCLVAYAVFGPSPYLMLGPDSSLGPIIAAIILPLAAGSMERAVASRVLPAAESDSFGEQLLPACRLDAARARARSEVARGARAGRTGCRGTDLRGRRAAVRPL